MNEAKENSQLPKLPDGWEWDFQEGYPSPIACSDDAYGFAERLAFICEAEVAPQKMSVWFDSLGLLCGGGAEPIPAEIIMALVAWRKDNPDEV